MKTISFPALGGLTVRVSSERLRLTRCKYSGRDSRPAVIIEPSRSSPFVTIAHDSFGAVSIRKRHAARIIRQARRGVGVLAHFAGFPENLAR